MWIGPSQKSILKLADELGVERYAQYEKGSSLFEFEGKVHKYAFLVPVIGISIVEVRFCLHIACKTPTLQFIYRIVRLNRDAKRVNTEHVRATPNAKDMDVSVQRY